MDSDASTDVEYEEDNFSTLKTGAESEKCKIDGQKPIETFLTHLKLVGILPDTASVEKLTRKEYDEEIKLRLEERSNQEIDELFSKDGLLNCKTPDLNQLGLIYKLEGDETKITQIRNIKKDELVRLLKEKIKKRETLQSEENDEGFNDANAVNLVEDLSENEMEGYEGYTDSDLDNLLTGYDEMSGSYSDASYDIDSMDSEKD